MQILSKEPERWRLRVTSEDDLWALAQLIRPRMQFGMVGERRDQTTASGEGERARAAERKTMWILLEVRSTEHPNFNAQLRVHGTIIEAAIDKGHHHTHIVGRGKEIELRNPDGFLPLDEHLLTHAVEAGTSARFAVLVAEHDQAQLFLVTARGVHETASFEGGGIGKRVSGKEADAVQRSFFRRVAEETIDQIGDLPLILAGPGSARDRIRATVLDRTGTAPPSIGTSMAGRAGAHEILGSAQLQELISGHALAREFTLLEEAWQRVGTDGAVAYGSEHLQRAAEMGAVEHLLIAAEVLRVDADAMEHWSELATTVEAMRGEVVQCSTHHDSGAQLLAFGGAVALLRFKV